MQAGRVDDPHQRHPERRQRKAARVAEIAVDDAGHDGAPDQAGQDRALAQRQMPVEMRALLQQRRRQRRIAQFRQRLRPDRGQRPHHRAPFDNQKPRDMRHHRNGHSRHMLGLDRMGGVGDQA